MRPATADGERTPPPKPWDAVVRLARSCTGVHRPKLLVGLTVAVLSCVLTAGYGSMLLSDLAGFAYPAYATGALLLRAPDAVAPNAQANKWLTYWLTFAAVVVMERACAPLIRLLPFYCTLKTVFFVWCFAPIEMNGSELVFDTVVRGYLVDRLRDIPAAA